jgi:hypothetical protein
MRRALCLASLALFAVGCGHARLVQRTQTGGTFALEGDRVKAMEDASAQMSAHCRGPYTIVSEGENVIGSDTAQTDETFVTKDGTVVKQKGRSTRDAVEWRVEYVCGNVAPGQYAQPPAYDPYAQPQHPQGQPQDPYGAPQPPPPPPSTR